MIYFFLVILVLITAFLLLRLRVRVELTENKRILFAGLGRSGVEIDFLSHTSRIKWFGITVRTIYRPEEDGENEPITTRPISQPEKKKPSKLKTRSKSSASVMDIIRISIQVISAGWKFIVEIFKSIIVEEAEADIRAGFDSPNITGEIFGYYQPFMPYHHLASEFGFILTGWGHRLPDVRNYRSRFPYMRWYIEYYYY